MDSVLEKTALEIVLKNPEYHPLIAVILLTVWLLIKLLDAWHRWSDRAETGKKRKITDAIELLNNEKYLGDDVIDVLNEQLDSLSFNHVFGIHASRIVRWHVAHILESLGNHDINLQQIIGASKFFVINGDGYLSIKIKMLDKFFARMAVVMLFVVLAMVIFVLWACILLLSRHEFKGLASFYFAALLAYCFAFFTIAKTGLNDYISMKAGQKLAPIVEEIENKRRPTSGEEQQ